MGEITEIMGISAKNPRHPLAPLPADWQENYFSNRHGDPLHYGFAPARGGASKGTVILTHGYGEFIELYAEAIGEYQKMGFDVWAMDFHGFGKSGRNRNAPSENGMMEHADDLHEFVTRIVQPDRNKPVLMNTHSMGGHIGLLYLQKYPGTFDGAVMSAPMFDIYRLGLPVAMRPVIQGIFNLASKIGLRDIPVPETPEIWTRMRDLYHDVLGREKGGLREEFYQKARQAETKRPTPGWLSSAFETVASSTTHEALRSVKTPVLIGSAGLENLVDADAHERAVQLMQDAKVVKLPTARHGLWFENDANYSYWLNQVKTFTHRLTEQFDMARSGQTAPVPLFTAGHKVEVMPAPERHGIPVFAGPAAAPELG